MLLARYKILTMQLTNKTLLTVP